MLGITISKCNPYSLEYIDAYCRFNDKYDIPLGYAYNGMNTDDGHYLRQTLDTIYGGIIIIPTLAIKMCRHFRIVN